MDISCTRIWITICSCNCLVVFLLKWMLSMWFCPMFWLDLNDTRPNDLQCQKNCRRKSMTPWRGVNQSGISKTSGQDVDFIWFFTRWINIFNSRGEKLINISSLTSFIYCPYIFRDLHNVFCPSKFKSCPRKSTHERITAQMGLGQHNQRAKSPRWWQLNDREPRPWKRGSLQSLGEKNRDSQVRWRRLALQRNVYPFEPKRNKSTLILMYLVEPLSSRVSCQCVYADVASISGRIPFFLSQNRNPDTSPLHKDFYGVAKARRIFSFFSQCGGTFRNLTSISVPEPSGTSPRLCAGTLRNLT